MPVVCKMAKYQRVKPAMENILRAGKVESQAAVLRANADHPSLAPTCKLARINSSKEQAAYKFICKQSSHLMKQNHLIQQPHTNVTGKKRDAAKVMLIFSAPLPEKVTSVPSHCEHAHVRSMPQSTLATREKALIVKRRQLCAGEKGVYWALTKRKKGYYKIDKAVRLLLVAAFKDYPHIIVSLNGKDTLQLKNTNGTKVPVLKVLMQVGLGTIFSDIVKNNPTIKNKVGERAFHYIISGLGRVHHSLGCYVGGISILARSLIIRRGFFPQRIYFNVCTQDVFQSFSFVEL